MKKIKSIYLILLFAFLIRLISLNQSLWLDEAIQSWSATDFSLFSLLKNYMPSDFNPPLLHVLLWFWVRIFGNSEISIRFISVLAGVGVVYFSHLILGSILPSSKKQNKELINIGTILISISPLLIFYSQEARPYILAAFFVSWSMYEFLLILKNKKPKFFNLKYLLATTGMFFSHYLVWFIFPTQIIILILTSDSRKDFFNKLKPLLTPLLSLILILPILIPQLKVGLGAQGNLPVWQNLSSFSFRQLALIPIKILIGRLPIDFNLKSTILIPIPLLIWAYLIFRKFKLKSLLKYFKKNKEFTLLLSWLVIPVLIGILLSFKISIFTYFRFLYITPAFILLLIYSLKNFDSKKIIIFLFPFILISTISSSIYLTKKDYHRENWQQTVRFIKNSDYSDKVIILDEVNKPFEYYNKGQLEIYDYSQVDDLRFANYLWLVKYAQPIFELNNETEQKLENYGFTCIKEKYFRGDITVKLMFSPYFLNTNKN